MNENIGSMNCLVCGEPVPVKAQRNGKAMLNCGWCGFQGYARGEHCDNLLRTKMTPVAAAVKQALETPTETKPAAKRGGIMDAL